MSPRRHGEHREVRKRIHHEEHETHEENLTIHAFNVSTLSFVLSVPPW
jgi:hypothetical protein